MTPLSHVRFATDECPQQSPISIFFVQNQPGVSYRSGEVEATFVSVFPAQKKPTMNDVEWKKRTILDSYQITNTLQISLSFRSAKVI